MGTSRCGPQPALQRRLCEDFKALAAVKRRRQQAPTDDKDIAVRHLTALPRWLASDSTDTVLAVGQTDFQVHGLLLTAQSEVLAQAIACGARKKETIPLEGDEVHLVAAALAYLYRRSFQRLPAAFLDKFEAIRVAAFAQKYNAPNLQQEADHYLAESVGFKAHGLSCPATPGGFHFRGTNQFQPTHQFLPTQSVEPAARVVLIEPPPDHSNDTSIASLNKIQSWDMFDYMGAAEEFKLPLFQQRCLNCLRAQTGIWARHQRRLEQLSSCVLVALLISVAN